MKQYLFKEDNEVTINETITGKLTDVEKTGIKINVNGGKKHIDYNNVKSIRKVRG